MSESDGAAVESWPFRFACRRSGNCCARPGGMVAVSADEVRAIAAHLGLGEAGFRSRYLAVGGDRLVDAPGGGGACVFLEPGAPSGCGIYPVRPAKCASWPYWPELRERPEVLAEALRFCPGLEADHAGGAADRDDAGG